MNPVKLVRQLVYSHGLAALSLPGKRQDGGNAGLPPSPALACTIVVTPDGNFVGTPPQVCAVLEAILRSGEHQSTGGTCADA